LELPAVEFGGVSLPSISFPSGGMPGLSALPDLGGGAGQAILWVLVMGGGLIALWPLLRAMRGRTEQNSRTAAKTWPVDPRHISTRQDLIRAFDYFAELL